MNSHESPTTKLIITKNEQNLDDKDHQIRISSKKLWYIFSIFAIVSLVSNFDNGIIPCSTQEIKISLNNISDSQLGLIGSADYFGRIGASFLYLSIINKINRKIILAMTLLVKGTTLILCIYKHYIFIIIMRVLSGCCQVFYTIYLPMWCDQFGEQKKRTLMIALIQLGLPFGIVCGYALALVLKKDNWGISLIIDGILCILLGIFVISFDNLVFDKRLIKINVNKDNENKEDIKIKMILFEIKEIEESKSTLCKNLLKILLNPIYMIMTLGISLAYFTMGGIKFWSPYYIKTIYPNREYDIAYLVISFTGPTLGIVLGGIGGTLVGGYSSKKAIIVCLIFAILSSIAGIFSPNEYISLYLFLILLWLYFFLSTGIVPLGTGIVINSVSHEIKGDALTINNFLQNSFGNLPPSYVYGIIKQSFGSDDIKGHRIAMRIMFCCGIVNSVNLFIGSFIRYFCTKDNENKDDEKKDIKNEDTN